MHRELDGVVKKVRAPFCLDPTFIVIGAMKGGTTSLYRYLLQHPAVGGSEKKEVSYFREEYRRGPAWYRGHFPTRGLARRVRKQMGITPAIGEGSVGYLIAPQVPRLVHEYNPEMKLIALLRDPVARAYSHHQHQMRLGAESLSFEEALEEEAALSPGEMEDMLVNSRIPQRKPYLWSGRYIEHIEHWLDVFPRGQLLLLCSEDLYRDAAAVMVDVVQFLELPAWNDWAFKVWTRGTYAPMRRQTREFLAAYYEEPNRQLYEFLGRDLGWTRPAACRAGV